jgi:N-acetylmuramoyl-L-alanine amidase
MLTPLCHAGKLSPLAPAPDWSKLKPYQQTITQAAFSLLIDSVYAPGGGFWKYAKLGDKSVEIFSDTAHTHLFTLRFATNESTQRSRPRYYFPEPGRPPPSVALRNPDPKHPLVGIKICLDPGHLGGNWAKLEERYFVVGKNPPVLEARLNLVTCRHIATQLEALGATVSWTKQDEEPVTTRRPADLDEAAREAVRNGLRFHTDQRHATSLKGLTAEAADMLFYRNAEITARAEKVAQFAPDLTICVHYNASAWGQRGHPEMVATSRLVVFTNGAYSGDELAYDDEKFEMLRKLLDRTAPLEKAAAFAIADELEKTFEMPPEPYAGSSSVHRIGSNPYVFARNLMANRKYRGPVVFVEGPYMNAHDAYPRLIAGDYEGTRKINGAMRRSIFRDYADAVVKGLKRYFKVQSSKE